ERRLYGAWTALPALDWDAYAPIAREVFDISRELASLWEPGWRELAVESLCDGEIASPGEPVMHIQGEYAAFAHLETLYLGALAEGTRVATNTRDVVAAANGKPVIMFGARHQVHEAQAGAGYAAYVGGAIGVSTDEQGEWWGSTGLGTVPHALIVASGGFDAEKIRRFEQLGVPVDVYGVGSALVHGSGFDHTADIVRVDGRELAKEGRRYIASDRLHAIDWKALVGERDWARSSS